jgi:uncharacterized membrane protein YfcA
MYLNAEVTMPNIEWMLLYGTVGLSVGLIAGMLGVGGGGILVPLLAMIFRHQDFDQTHIVHYALGTTFACMIFSSLSSIKAHAHHGYIIWNLFITLSSGIILGTFVTTRVAVQIHSDYIAIFFAIFMALIALQMFLNWKPNPSNTPSKLWHTVMIGAGIGAVSAVAAVGGGFLTITYLNYKNIAFKKAIGTSAAIGLPIAIAGTIGYLLNGWSETASSPYMFGFIYMPAFLIISITSALAAPVGANFTHRLPDAYLKKVFAIMCLALSLKMLTEIL